MATTTIAVSQEDITAADTFLAAYITAAIPTGDFSPGTANRDFTVGAIARVFAFLRSEVNTSRSMQSILQISNLPDSTDRDEAADAILSNLFLNRNPGRKTHITVTLHFSKAVDVTIGTSIRYFRTTGLIFFVDSIGTYTAPANSLIPTVNSDGSIKDYILNVPMVAADVGTDYNQAAGKFVGADVFNPYFLYAENTADGKDGRAIQTTTEMIDSAPDGLSTRNLVNIKSISAVLKAAFSDISRVVVTGMGDPEMIRDLTTEAVTQLRMHVGGMYDAFVDLPRTTVTENLTLGGLFARPDGLVTILRDNTANLSGARVGQVLRVSTGLTDAPRVYLVTGVGPNYVQVNARTPFSRATDEDATPSTVTYSLGYYAPLFNDVLTEQTTGVTSRQQGAVNTVILAGQPHYEIKSVVLSYNDTLTTCGPRVNRTPTGLEYQVITQNPEMAQSARAVTQIVIASDNPNLPTLPNVPQVLVSYETLVDYAAVQATLVDSFTRTVCANTLAKGFHPVYVSASINYDLATGTAPTDVPDDAAMATAVTDFINSFPTTDALNASAISKYLILNYPLAGVYPITLYYTLVAPDGQLYKFATQDTVRVFPDTTHSAQLINGADLRVPLPDASLPPVTANTAKIASANQLLQAQLEVLGISDQVVRYLADSTDITCSPR